MLHCCGFKLSVLEQLQASLWWCSFSVSAVRLLKRKVTAKEKERLVLAELFAAHLEAFAAAAQLEFGSRSDKEEAAKLAKARLVAPSSLDTVAEPVQKARVKVLNFSLSHVVGAVTAWRSQRKRRFVGRTVFVSSCWDWKIDSERKPQNVLSSLRGARKRRIWNSVRVKKKFFFLYCWKISL